MSDIVMRTRRVWALLAVPVAAAALLTGCGGAAAERVLTLDGLAEAAVSTAESSSGRFTFGMDMTAPDGYETISFSGYGAFDTAANKTQMSLDLSSFASLFGGLATAAGGDAPDFANPELWKLQAVQDGLVMYMQSPLLTRVPGVLPRGKTWVKVDLRRAGRTQGFDLDQLQQLTSNDPRDVLRFLEAVGGDLERLGDEQLHGVETTHYQTTVDLLKYKRLVPASERENVGSMIDELVRQSGLRTIPVEVWVDGDSLVHKLTMTFSATQPGTSQSFEAAIRFELYDYGQPVTIAMPPLSKTVDAFALQRR